MLPVGGTGVAGCVGPTDAGAPSDGAAVTAGVEVAPAPPHAPTRMAATSANANVRPCRRVVTRYVLQTVGASLGHRRSATTPGSPIGGSRRPVNRACVA